AVTALLTAVVFVTARTLWWAFKHPPRRLRAAFRPGPDADAALRRHPAGRGRRGPARSPPAPSPPPSPPVAPPVGARGRSRVDALERLIRGDGDDIYPA